VAKKTENHWFFERSRVLIKVKLRQRIDELKKRKGEGEKHIDDNYIKLLNEIHESGACSEFIDFVF